MNEASVPKSKVSTRNAVYLKLGLYCGGGDAVGLA